MSEKKRYKRHRGAKLILLLILAVFALTFVKAPPTVDPATMTLASDYEAYRRGEEQTYLTFPEWYIVYSSDEYARFIKTHPPSAFPYFSSIGQFWSGYWQVYRITSDRYPFNMGYHVMVAVIGTSLTVEYTIKGVYENTVGRISEATTDGVRTEEDDFAANMAADYVEFIKVNAWYEYDFAKKLMELGQQTHLTKANLIRQIERKMILSVEYATKAGYGWVMKKLTYLSYEPESPFTGAELQNLTPAMAQQLPKMRAMKPKENNLQFMAIPRYQAFMEYAQLFAQQGVKFATIAGNSKAILVTLIAPQEWQYTLPEGKVMFTQTILTQPTLKRMAIEVPVAALTTLINAIPAGCALEHIYDY